ncbi:cubilin-like [Glandiceps talaboti]
MASCSLSSAILVMAVVFLTTAADTSRSKRAASDDTQPKMITQSGHLIFQTGTNHNISFKTDGTGRVVIDDYDFIEIAEMVKKNKQDIQSIFTQLQGIPSDLQTQLDDIKTDISDLKTRVTNLESVGGPTVPGDLADRVGNLEDDVDDLQNDLSADECTSNPCKNGGTCVNLYKKFQCRCTEAWKGTTCESDVDECVEYRGTDLGCQNGATCDNTDGGYSCTCKPNWFGVHCRSSHDDCTGGSHSELCDHGMCIDEQRSDPDEPNYICLCDEGWEVDPDSSSPACTQDVDECTNSQTYPCSHDPLVSCINYPGGFVCGSCPAGFTGNGFQCADINECDTDNGGCSESPKVECTNRVGYHECGPCPAAYEGDGETCRFVGICSQNNGGCYILATCTEVPALGDTYRTCTCPNGYTGNGFGSDGCELTTPSTTCDDDPCVNGYCQQQGFNYFCVCDPGWNGQNCDNNVDECACNPCQNSGTCVDGVNGYSCTCASGYTGDNCEQQNQGCGGVLASETGTLSFPIEGGSTYPHGASCAWRIRTTTKKIIHVEFSEFDLEEHTDCNYDFLQIHDGYDTTYQLIGQFCGTTKPDAFNTTHNDLYMWFKSDSAVSGHGFTLSWTSLDPHCGGEITGESHGSINSPGYPGVYPHDTDCTWTITVEPGQTITVAFGTLALEEHENCSFDYLEILDGLTESSTSLGKWCSSITPSPVTTSGPYAYIHFHSDATNSDDGFHVTWVAGNTATCGGRLTDESAVIISPDWPNAHPHSEECIWVVEVPEGAEVTFKMTDIDLEAHSNCLYDYVEVRDGVDETGAFMGRYCGNSVPPPVTSSSNQLWIKFYSDGSVAGTGFRAEYFVACGGVYTETSGEFTTPYFPDAYPNDKTCEYVIQQLPGYVITLTFVTFDIEGSTDCIFDYVEIRDGQTIDSPLISKLCGTSVPAPIISTQNNMYVRFVSDGSLSNHGFRATYTISEGGTSGECGGSFTDPIGIFTSPSHPDSYPHGLSCAYVIDVEEGYIIRLTFNSFQLEQHSLCNYDYVAVYDNCTQEGCGLRGKYCGSQTPPTITSISNVMTVLFVSDGSISYDGFSASYVSLDASSTCGGDVVLPSGSVMSPNYPDIYPGSQECIWIITAQAGNQIMVNISDIDIEYHSLCNYDYLEIRNGGYASSPLIGTFCGTEANPSVFASHGNRLYIKFKVDSSVGGRGFRIDYDATSTGCGAELSGASGSFTSPNYPMPYGHNAECAYMIRVAAGSIITLYFAEFDLERHSNCAYDYVRVYDGDSEAADQIGNVCGDQIPLPISSTSNVMYIKFRTDFSNSGNGFYASYHADCNQRITGLMGAIESPNWPYPYPHYRDCTWVIEAWLGNKINMSFTNFHLSGNADCQADYLQIHDGENEDAPELGTFCGTDTNPGGFASTSNFLYLRFVSDSAGAGNGFRAEWVMDGCGGHFSGKSGNITSQGYPNDYPASTHCEWSITVTPGSSIQLIINDVDLEGSTGCRYDALHVYGGPDTSSPLLSSICHEHTGGQHVASTGNHMLLRLESDGSISGRGFHASYTEVPGGCGGNYSLPTGEIHSRNYPQAYDHNSDCNWLITVQDYHHVILTFTEFEIELPGNNVTCRYDYVRGYDGPDEDSALLFDYCGNGLPSNPVIQSTSNQIYIRMVTDASVSGTGFSATYETGCGGYLDASVDGFIQSTNYPDNHNPNMNCTWVIESPNLSDKVTLTFTHLEIEPYGECQADYILILDGNDADAPEIARLCGTTIPAAITSTGNALFVNFIADFSVQGTGFFARYTTSTSVCGADYAGVSGAFNSPMYPNNYPIETECVWTISPSPGNRVLLAFSLFDIEPAALCQNDYIEVRDGNDTGRLIGRYCGNTPPSNITAVSRLWVKFRSDGQRTGIGFMASYSMVPGGDWSGSAGQVTSPGYPNRYPTSIDVVWTITVQSDMMIRISFQAFALETSSTCRYDYLQFNDGPTEDSALIDTFCGNIVPAPFFSTGNVLYVKFHSDFSISYTGFLFDWVAVSEGATVSPPGDCSATMQATETAQTFTSPGYPDGYAINLNCGWIIRTHAGHKLKVQITDLSTEGGPDCVFDKVQFYDGEDENSDDLGAFCGIQTNLDPVFSTGSTMFVNFVTDSSTNGTGFLATYQSVCGGRLDTNLGIITSPSYPNNYPDSASCEWTIQTSSGTTIDFNFTVFDIQGSAGSCTNDYVQLFDGENDQSPVLGAGPFCGSAAPTDLKSTSNIVFAKFVSDSSTSSTGFVLSYSTVTAACGGSLVLTDQSTSGVLTSPSYPENYPHSIECEWTISAPSNEAIQIAFTDFELEPSATCSYDSLQIRDGGSDTSAILATVCGSTPPDTYTSSGNAMYLKFKTDSSTSHKGFSLTYSIATCGGTVSGEAGIITSPNYPGNYDNNLECDWYIRGPTGHYLTFSFDAFSLAGSDATCNTGDYLDIAERNLTHVGPLIDTFCGTSLPASVDTSDSYAHITFVTDGTDVSTGFQLQWTTSIEECGGDLTNPSGTFSSPNYPGQYAHSRVCEWRITVTSGHRITLTFTDFNIEQSSTCSYDYVETFNGMDDSAPSLGRLCGSTIPFPVQSSGNQMRVKFVSDGSVAAQGFLASYSSEDASVCGGTIDASAGDAGVIFSPNHGVGNYTSDTECIWVINHDDTVNSSIVITFTDFDLEQGVNCAYDYVEIRMGSEDSAPYYGRYCGADIPDIVLIPTRSAWIKFRSDRSLNRPGFRANWELQACGGYYTSNDGVIASPNFPDNYDHNDRCVWLLETAEGSTMTCTFTDFTVETHTNCKYDYLSARNGGHPDSPQISGEDPWCGTSVPDDFNTGNNQLFLVFKTDGSSSAQGFRLTWTTATSGCGGNFHSNTGSLGSSNYPSNYNDNEECIWKITVEHGYHITLTFDTSFGVSGGTGCDQDYVEVRDGPDGDSPLIGLYCGTTAPVGVKSSSDVMRVKFHSNSATSDVGFQATWQTACGANFTEATDRITSPGYGIRDYPNSLDCEYVISFEDNQPLIITFDAVFGIEDHPLCGYDYLAIYSGTDSTGELLVQLCGTETPDSLAIFGPAFIKFHTDRSNTADGFGLNYEEGCGGNLTDAGGIVQTPPHLERYKGGQNCTWYITVSSDMIVELKWQMMDIEAHSSCRYDSVQVFDGHTTTGLSLSGPLCGTTLPQSIISNSNRVLVNFVSDSSVAGAGFRLAYRATYGPSHGCGGDLTDSSGQFTSLDADTDGSYENDLECVWRINVGLNQVVKLTFTSTFDIETSTDCTNDYIEVRDGLLSEASLIGRYCGSTKPGDITSSSNTMYVLFHSDSGNGGTGFSASYTSEGRVCGGTYNATSTPLTLSSPNYPSNYDHNSRCRWVIDAPEEQTVKLDVSSMDVKSNDGNCVNDFVEFRDSPMYDGGQTFRYCGTNTPPIFYSAGRTVEVNFQSDATSSGQGFQLEYVVSGCTRTFNMDNGRVTSPNYPNNYPVNAECNTTIIASPGTKLAMYFNAFTMEYHGLCNYDYLKVYEGTDMSGTQLANLCGTSSPDPIFINSNSLFMQFKTDRSITHPGYDATFASTTNAMSGCGGTFTSFKGAFTSPGYPSAYNTTSMTCEWTITVPAGRQAVSLVFEHLAIDGTEGVCSTDKLEVFDGTSDSSSSFGRFCGTTTPANVQATGRSLFVRFTTDSTNSDESMQGFRVKFVS